jgi:hypothetical protein
MQTLSGIIEVVIGGIITSALPGYIALQIVTAVWFRGRWLIASFLPLVVFVPLLVQSLYALSASSNLWPILLIFFAPVGCLYLAILIVARYYALKAV